MTESNSARVRRRFRGLLPQFLLRPRPPVLWQETLLIGIGYWLYETLRNAVPSHLSAAHDHAREVLDFEGALRVDWELALNQFVSSDFFVGTVLDYYYATMHFVVTPGVLIWLGFKHKTVYRGARTVLFTSSIIGLAGFWLYPLAPPRLVPNGGFVDTVVEWRTWGSLYDAGVAAHENLYAAMPSLHFAWAAWAGLALYYCSKNRWVRGFGLFHPAMTVVVIVGTGNHYIFDAIGGAAVLALGFAIQRLLSGRGAFDEPEHAAAKAVEPSVEPEPATDPLLQSTSS